VFTLPDQLSPLALQNKRVIYGLLFQAASETLLKIAADPKHLGAVIGFLAVLHTWGQTLQHHPHLHCVVPGGGLSPDHFRWIGCRKGFFLPVKVLSRLFRGKFVAYLKAANEQGRLVFRGQSKHLAEGDHFASLLNEVSKREWVVYAKRPVWRTSASVEVSGALHPSSCYIQSTTGVAFGRKSDLPMERLC